MKTLLLDQSYVARIGISAFREEEKTVPTREERRIPAGINWAKTTMIPKVRKNQTPKSPIPLIPPAKAIPNEPIAIERIKTELRIIKIFFILLDMVFTSFNFFIPSTS
jgi:hypothetical protein